MNNEIEAQFLEIDKDAVREDIKHAGGELLQAEVKMKRVIFDAGEHQYIRVRDEGKNIVMTYKNVMDDHNILGTKEVNVVVDDFDKAVELMKGTHLPMKAYMETKREKWILNDCEICIDTWPWIPTYIEVEGPSEEKVWETVSMLGFKKEDAKFGCVDQIYNHYYGVDCDTVNYKTPIITFDCDLPEWVDPDILEKINPLNH